MVRTETIEVPVLEYVEIPPELLVCEHGLLYPWMTWFYALTVLDEATAVCRANMQSIKKLQNTVIEND